MPIDMNSDINAVEDEVQADRPDARERGYPWDGMDDRRETRTFNIRLTDALFEKLTYASTRSRISKHRICMTAIRPFIEKLIHEITVMDRIPDPDPPDIVSAVDELSKPVAKPKRGRPRQSGAPTKRDF
jgi:hypothetical protein